MDAFYLAVNVKQSEVICQYNGLRCCQLNQCLSWREIKKYIIPVTEIVTLKHSGRWKLSGFSFAEHITSINNTFIFCAIL